MSSTLRCKFFCEAVTKTRRWDGAKYSGFVYTAKFRVVVADTEENKRFFEATPNGVLEIGTLKEESFTPGLEYYLDMTPSA